MQRGSHASGEKLGFVFSVVLQWKEIIMREQQGQVEQEGGGRGAKGRAVRDVFQGKLTRT